MKVSTGKVKWRAGRVSLNVCYCCAGGHSKFRRGEVDRDDVAYWDGADEGVCVSSRSGDI